MEHKKDIGKLFNEKLSTLSATPTSDLWQKIELELPKKKKKTLVPFWMWTSAGLLFLGFGLTVFFYNRIQEDNFLNKEKIKSSEIEKLVIDKANQKEQDAVFNGPQINANNELIFKSQSNDSTSLISKKAVVQTSKKSNKKNILARVRNKLNIKKQLPDREQNTSSRLIVNDLDTNKADYLIKDKIKFTTVIDTLLKNDSIAIVEIEKLKDLPNNLEKNNDKSKSDFRDFYIFSYVAPTQYKLISDNLIDENISSEKRSELIFNYGAYFGFAINEKLSFRIGYNRAKLNVYSNDINIQGVNKFSNIIYVKNVSNSTASAMLNENFVNVNQRLNFIEIPVEAKYRFFNKKISLEAIGGISSLYLEDNSVSFQSATSGNSLDVGKIKDVLKISFSANVGLGVSYKLNNLIDLNVEPNFKYHINSMLSSSLGIQAGIQFNLDKGKL